MGGGSSKEEPEKQRQLQAEKQYMVHEAQMDDCQKRIMSAINSLAKAIESSDQDRIHDEENNLNIQVTVASGVFNDKKYKKESEKFLNNLKADFKKYYKNVPDRIKSKLDEYINPYLQSFDKPIKNDIALKGDTSKPLTEQDQKAMLGSLNYANAINDQMRQKAEKAKNSSELSNFVQDNGDPINDPNYMPNYQLKEEHKEVFIGYAESGKKRGYKDIDACHDESNPIAFLDITINTKPIGRIFFELMKNHVPNTVKEFISYCDGSHPDGKSHKESTFNYIRPASRSLVLSKGKYYYPVPEWAEREMVFDHKRAGLISMLVDSNIPFGTQFIITNNVYNRGDGYYIPFGKIIAELDQNNNVVYEMSILRQIINQGSDNGQPKATVMISNCGVTTYKEIKAKNIVQKPVIIKSNPTN